MWGSLSLAGALFHAGMVDRLRLRVVPVLIGAGRGSTSEGLATTKTTLTRVQSYPRGHVTLDYVVHRGPGNA